MYFPPALPSYAKSMEGGGWVGWWGLLGKSTEGRLGEI